MAAKLRLALLGCGRIAQVHWRGIQESCGDLITVSACIDLFLPRAQAMAEKVSAATGETCAAFTSLAEAIASQQVHFEAVDIMLLHNQHEAAAVEAIEAGLEVLLEKPMSITPESCARIVRAAQARGNRFWVAEQEQYAPAILTAQRLIKEGAIGKTVTLHTMGAGGRQAPTKAADALPPPKGAGGQGEVLAAAGMPTYRSVWQWAGVWLRTSQYVAHCVWRIGTDSDACC
jgi:predicted dehydrogenase